jgi:hypothetical protein
MSALSAARLQTTWPHRGAYRAWGAALCAFALLVLAHNLGLLPPAVRAITRWWPAPAAVFSLWCAWRRWGLGLALPTFAVPRGTCEGASLVIASGFASARVSAFAGATQLAVGEFPAPAGPRLAADEHWARLTLDRRAAAPLLPGPWSAQLAKNLPWTIAARAFTGDIILEARDLNVATLQARSVFGDVQLSLPLAGQGAVDARSDFGDVVLRVPEGGEVKLVVRAGRLANGKVTHPRFSAAAPGEWVTPGFEAAAQRRVVTVSVGAGDLRVE